MSNKRAILTVVALLLVVNITLGIKWYLASRNTPSAAPCVVNLRQIANAKLKWSIEQLKTPGEVPTWENLQPSLPQRLSCPDGGSYTLGRVDQSPSCSIGGPNHSLSATPK